MKLNILESLAAPVLEDEGGGSGAPVNAEAAAMAGEGGEGTAPEVTSAAPPAPQNVSLTPETIKTLVSSLGAQAPAPAPQAPPRELTQEEIDKRLNVFRATEEHMQRLGLDPKAAGHFNEIVSAIVKQAVTMAYVTMEGTKRELTERIEPLSKYMSEAREERLRTEFFSENEDLKQFEPLARAVWVQLNANGAKFASKEEAFKAVAEQTRQLLAKMQPGQGGGNGTATPATNAPRKMPTVTTGGRGGAAPSGGGGKVDPTAKAMWG